MLCFYDPSHYVSTMQSMQFYGIKIYGTFRVKIFCLTIVPSQIYIKTFLALENALTCTGQWFSRIADYVLWL